MGRGLMIPEATHRIRCGHCGLLHETVEEVYECREHDGRFHGGPCPDTPATRTDPAYCERCDEARDNYYQRFGEEPVRR